MRSNDKDISRGGILRAVGLMSGTSMDGVDAALIETDGENHVSTGASLSHPYPEPFRTRLREVVRARGETALLAEVEQELVERHAAAVQALLTQENLKPTAIDVVGFHGHTVHHDPAQRLTSQIGDGAQLARQTGIDVVNDLRAADVRAGGQGAPLVPLFHRALAAGLAGPIAILNIGGVANVTYLGIGDPIAFDTGPGNALIDDLFLQRTGVALDKDGMVAASGTVDQARLATLMSHPYFQKPVPKSLDRDAFDATIVDSLSLADAAATLVAFTVAGVAAARAFFPAPPRRWLITGGGRHNRALMAALAQALQAPVEPVEAVSWQGDALEAQAFGYLAVRSLRGLPLTLPTTTGVPHPLTGGVLHRA